MYLIKYKLKHTEKPSSAGRLGSYIIIIIIMVISCSLDTTERVKAEKVVMANTRARGAITRETLNTVCDVLLFCYRKSGRKPFLSDQR